MSAIIAMTTEDVEMILSPSAEPAVVQISVAPPARSVLDSPMNLLLLTHGGALAFAECLREVDRPGRVGGLGQLEDDALMVTVETSPFGEGALITVASHPPHANGWRAMVLQFSLAPPDGRKLAGLLEQAVMLAAPAGGAA